MGNEAIERRLAGNKLLGGNHMILGQSLLLINIVTNGALKSTNVCQGVL